MSNQATSWRDEKGNLFIRPPPSILSISALKAQGDKRNLRQLVDDIRAKGIKVTLTPEQQADYDALKAQGA